jgi:cell division protein FtsB
MSKFLYLAQVKQLLLVPRLRISQSRLFKYLSSFKVGTILIASLILFILVFYIHQINKVSVAGLRLRNLEKKLETLKEENRRLEEEIMRKRSLENLYQEAQSFNLVSQNNIEYIEGGEKSIVLRQE